MWENHVGTMNVPNFVSVHRAEVYEFHRLTELCPGGGARGEVKGPPKHKYLY